MTKLEKFTGICITTCMVSVISLFFLDATKNLYYYVMIFAAVTMVLSLFLVEYISVKKRKGSKK